MNELTAKIEAVLFLVTRPMTYTKLARVLGVKESEIETGVRELSKIKNQTTSGIHVVVASDEVSLGTNPEFTEIVSAISKEEIEAELTRPQLETLTIVAYRGPITKAEIEHIRGVNCSIIIRNLLIRGLIEEGEDASKITPVFTLSSQMLKSLGAHNVEELPDYLEFHKNAKIDQMLEAITKENFDIEDEI